MILSLLMGFAAPVTAAPVVSPFGIGLHSTMGDSISHAGVCALVKAAGIRLVRDEISWCEVEKEKGVYAWPANIEANIDTTRAVGLEPLLILDYGNPLYDDGNAPSSPEGIAAYANYCRAMVSHYKGKVKYWEIWNEPNIEQFWKPKPDPDKYAILLKTASNACKEADPNCFVVGVCTSGVDLSFIKKVLAAGTITSMDALSVHPYRYPDPPEKGIISDLAEVRKAMDAVGGKGKPIWVTEVGWPTHLGPRGISVDAQAHMLVRAYLECLAGGAETVFWYWFGNDGPNPSYNEDHFGIRFREGTPKPAYIACQTMTKLLEGATYTRSLGLGVKSRARIFRRGDDTIAALWAVEGMQTITLKVGSGPVEVAGELGGPAELLYPLNGLIGLTLTEAPIYLKCQEDLTQSAVESSNPFDLTPLDQEVPIGSPAVFEARISNPCDFPLAGEIQTQAIGGDAKPVLFRVDARARTALDVTVTPGKPGRVVPMLIKVMIDDRPVALLRAQARPVARKAGKG